MKNFAKNITLFGAILAVLAGCGTKEVALSEAEKLEILNYVATSVPLVTEAGTGTVLYNDDLADLKDGRDLYVVTNAIRKEQKVSIAWSYREGDDLGSFEFMDNDATTKVARPSYPTYELLLDGSGNDVSVVPPTQTARLYADLTLQGTTIRTKFDMYLRPQILINWKGLDVIRDSVAKEIVGARGYITSIYPDYDALTIQDGEYAVTLYKVQSYSGAGFKIGDYVEAAGSWQPYNGLAEIGWIKRFNKTDPALHNAQLPVTHNITPADFQEWANAEPTEQFTAALYELDSAKVKMDSPLTLVRAENREGVTIALTELPVGNTHANVILSGVVGGETVNIKLSISYHVGAAAQQAIKDKLIAAGLGAKFTYEGILSWYNEPVLGIMNASDITLVN